MPKTIKKNKMWPKETAEDSYTGKGGGGGGKGPFVHSKVSLGHRVSSQ